MWSLRELNTQMRSSLRVSLPHQVFVITLPDKAERYLLSRSHAANCVHVRPI